MADTSAGIPGADLLNAAENIANSVSDVTMRHFRTGFDVESKADESPVTIADKSTEAALRKAINERFPDHGILGEEYGAENLDRDYVWIIDPIDGTKSFISGVPLFGTLLGVLKNGVPVAGVIRMAGLDETFVGGKGMGSRMNGTVIETRKGVSLKDAFISINELPTFLKDEPDVVARLMAAARYPRPTNDCYPYAQLAAGWIDGVVDFDLQPYDYLPLVGVIEGAGGIITDWAGKPLSMDSDGRVVAAATPELHEELLKVIAR